MSKLLIIDDHPAMIEGYKSILSCGKFADTFDITTANNCTEAFQIITSNLHYDIIFLDIILPADENNKIRDGIDLATLLRKLRPTAKLIILTSHTETFVLYSIIKTVMPEGFLVKSDVSAQEFLEAFNLIFDGGTFYSETVRNSIKNIAQQNTYLDRYNRQIIELLAKGIKTKNLPLYLNLSISAIDKRKSQIKDYFEIEKGTDEDIIRAARSRGFI